jgi:hypothetical protein
MNKFYLGLCTLLVTLFAWGTVAIGEESNARTDKDDGKTTLLVLMDSGTNDEMKRGYKKGRDAVATWMKRDLVNMIKRKGHETRMLENPEEFSPKQGTYLLSITVINYTGSKWVGKYFLKTRYELYGKDEKPLLSEEHEVFSMRGWKKCAKKLNTLTLEAVTEKLSEL